MRGPIPFFRRHVATVAGCVLAFVAVCLWLLHSGGVLPGSGGQYTVHALVPSAESVATGAQVTMAGAPVGKVAGVERRGMGAVVELELDDEDVFPLRADATAHIRARTPIGENYVEIDPGRASAKVQDGGQLRVAAEETFVDVDKLLSTLQGSTRERARELIQGAAEGVKGRGEELNALLGGLSTTLQEGTTVANTLVAQRRDVAELVDQLGRVAQAIGDRQDAVARTAERGLVAFRAVAARDEALDRVLQELPSTLTTVRDTSTLLRSAADTATPVVAGLADVTRKVRPAVRRLRKAATDGHDVVTELGKAAPGLRTTLRRVESLSTPARPVLAELRKTLCQVNPILRYAKPYAADIAQLFVNFGSASNGYDAISHTLRLMPAVGDNSLVGLPDELSKAAVTLLHSGFMTKLTGLSFQPFMKPGDVGKVKAEDVQSNGKAVVGHDGVRESGYQYPRIKADC